MFLFDDNDQITVPNLTTNKKVRKVKKNITRLLVVLTLLLAGIFASACSSYPAKNSASESGPWQTVNVKGIGH
jgi:hypothetical protein